MTDLARIGFAADTSGLKNAQRELDNTARSGENAERKLDKSIKNTNQGFMSMRQSIGLVGTALAALGSAALTRDLVKYSDTWKGVNSQIRQVTESEKELLAVRERVVQTAKETRSDLEATTKLYTALDRATTHLGVSTEKQIELTKTINNLFMSGGKSAQEASGAIRQLTQGLESGALRGDEFNSVAENAPRILDALASSLKMARGDLRDFAATGGITAEILVKALGDYNEEAQKLADQTEITFGQNMEIATTNITAFVGELDSVNSVVGSVGSSIAEISGDLGLFAENLDAWTSQFSGIGEDLDGTITSTSKTFRLEMIAMGAITDETLKFLTDAVKHFPANMRAIGQIIATELYSAVDIAGAAGKGIVTGLTVHLASLIDIVKIRIAAFGDVLGTQLGVIIKKAEIYGRQIKDALNPFDGDTFDHEQALRDAEKLGADLTNEYLSQADERVAIITNASSSIINSAINEAKARIDASRSARESIITDVMMTRNEQISSYEELIKRANESTGNLYKFAENARVEQSKAVKETKKELSEWEKITERSADRIDEAFADVWLNISDGFESVTDGLINSFKRMLAEMAHAAITRPIVMQITAAMGLGGLSGAASAASGLGGLLGATGAVGGAAGGLGQGAMLGGLAATSLSGATSMFGLGASSSMALLGEGAFGQVFSNIGGLFGGGQIMAGLGAAMPIIAGIAGIASLADSLTGGGLFGTSYSPTGKSLSLSSSGGDINGFTSLTEQKERSLFRGTKTRVTDTPFDTSGIDEIFNNLELSIVEAAELLEIDSVSQIISSNMREQLLRDFAGNNDIYEALTTSMTSPVQEWLDNFNASLKLDIEGMSEAEIQTEINNWVQRTTDAMIGGVFGDFLDGIQQEGETSADALTRVVANMTVFSGLAESLGLGFDIVGQEAAIAATNIVDLVGGLDSLSSLSSQYYSAFFSEQEQFEALTNSLESSFDQLGVSMPQTHSEFRALVESLDLSTESGQEMFAMLMQLVPGMDAYLTALEEQGEAVESLESQLSSAMLQIERAVDKEKELARERLTIAQELYEAQVIAIDAEMELAATRLETANATYQAQVEAIAQQRTLLNTQNSVLTDNLSFAENQLREAFNAEKLGITDASNARIAGLNAEKSIISASMSRMVSLANKMNQAAGNSITVEDALNAARKGNFSLAEQLNVSSLDSGGFGSAESMAFAQAKQNVQLAEIGGLAGSKASSQDALLSSIDRQIESESNNAQMQLEALDEQLNTLLGIDTSIPSIEEAIKLYNQAQLELDELNYESEIEKLDEQLSIAEEQLALAEKQYETEIQALENQLLFSEELLEIAEQQYTDEIERLDAILEDSEAQINALLGIDTSVMTVADAVNELSQVILDSFNYVEPTDTPADPSTPVDPAKEQQNEDVAAAIQASTRANIETTNLLNKIYKGEINVRVVNP